MPGRDQRTVYVMGNHLKREYSCAVPLTVGMIVEHDAALGKIKLSTAASTISRGGTMIVWEASERGKGIHSTGTTETTYAIGELVPCLAPDVGGHVLVLLKASQNVARGDKLEVEGGSGLVIKGAAVNVAAFTALEASNVAENALILAQVLS